MAFLKDEEVPNHPCSEGCIFVATATGVIRFDASGGTRTSFTEAEVSNSYGIAMAGPMLVSRRRAPARMFFSGPHAGHISYPENVVLPQLVKFQCGAEDKGP